MPYREDDFAPSRRLMHMVFEHEKFDSDAPDVFELGTGLIAYQKPDGEWMVCFDLSLWWFRHPRIFQLPDESFADAFIPGGRYGRFPGGGQMPLPKALHEVRIFASHCLCTIPVSAGWCKEPKQIS